MRNRAAHFGGFCAVVLSAFLLSACSNGSSSSLPASTSLSAPVSSGLASSSLSMVVFPMGHSNDPKNYFYESFTSSGLSPWKLSTPTGAATNGGISISSPTKGAAAILGFDYLHLAAGVALSGGFETGPGQVLPDLKKGPSSLSVSPSGLVAVLTADGRVMTAASLGGPYRLVTSQATLERTSAGKSCGLSQLSAVTWSAAGDLVVGGTCSTPGNVGVFYLSGSGVSPTSPVRWSQPLMHATGSPTTVLRLDAGGADVTALVASGTTGASVGVQELSGSLTSSQAVAAANNASQVLRVTPSSIIATSSYTTATGSVEEVLTYQAGAAAHVAVLAPGAAPVVSPSLPLTIQSAVVGVDGRTLDAFCVTNGGTLTVFSLGATGKWEAGQQVKVAVPYGSSN